MDKRIDNSRLQVNKTQNMFIFEIIIVLFFFAYSLLPVVSSAISFMGPLFLGIGYLAFIFIREPKWRQQILVFLLAVVTISVMYYILTDTTTISSSVSNYGLKRIFSKINQYFMTFFPACLFVRIYTKANYKQRRFLYFAAIVMFAIVMVNTFTELLVNDRASKNWSEFAEQSENNVGTYSFVYAVPMVITALTSLLYTLRGLGKKMIIIGIIAFLFTFLLAAQYTLALLISIIGIALQISANIKSATFKILLWLLFASILFLMPAILETMANAVQSEQIATRLKELSAFFGSGDVSGYNLSGRMELYWKAILAFLKSPIIGNRRLSFNPHATLLGVPADIGILGIYLLIMLIVKSKKYVSQLMGDRAKQFAPVVWCVVFMGLTNPIHSAFTALFATWLLAPMIIMIGDKNYG